MTIGAADIVSPMLAATEIIVFFLTRVASEAGFGDLFCVLVFEGNYLGFVAVGFDVGLAGAMTGFAADDLAFPCLELFEFPVFRVGDTIGLRIVTGGAGFRTDIFARVGRGTRRPRRVGADVAASDRRQTGSRNEPYSG
jgi:hypothetical protein